MDCGGGSGGSISPIFEASVFCITGRRRIWAEREEGEMQKRLYALLTVGLLMAVPVLAKSKDKVLPPYILQAHTVAVIVDPAAGVDPEDPQANRIAQHDVETALMNWGRFQRVMGPEGADLIIVIRKGHGRLVDATISDPTQNNRPGAINTTDNGMSVGAQNPNRQPNMGDPNGAGQQTQPRPSTQPQMEIGGTDDSFVVFDGTVAKPLNGAPGWRYTAPDGLRPHSVPAVEQFKKAVAAADKAAAAKKP
jgi:hypothetical protein